MIIRIRRSRLFFILACLRNADSYRLRLLYHFLPKHREQCIGMVISPQGMNFTSQQALRVKLWLKVSEHIFEMLALTGMLLVSFCSSRDYQSRCHSHFVVKVLF